MPSEETIYSLDASALIELDKIYPRDLFEPYWDFLGTHADAGTLVICEQAAHECKDADVVEWLSRHEGMIVKFDREMNRYMSALAGDMAADGIWLVSPNSDKDRADPFVIALALLREARDLTRLRQRIPSHPRCAVVQYEGKRQAPSQPKYSGKVRIPIACQLYALEHVDWITLLRREGWNSPR